MAAAAESTRQRTYTLTERQDPSTHHPAHCPLLAQLDFLLNLLRSIKAAAVPFRIKLEHRFHLSTYSIPEGRPRAKLTNKALGISIDTSDMLLYRNQRKD